MTTFKEWLAGSPERARDFAEERLIAEVAEEIWEAMERSQVTKSDIAQRLGKSKAFVGQVLNGTRNMTLRTLADIAHTLGRRVQVCLHDQVAIGEWQLMRAESFVQFRRPFVLEGTLDVGNHDEWQTLEGRESHAQAA